MIRNLCRRMQTPVSSSFWEGTKRADYVGESSLAIALEPAVFEDVVSILLELELQESLTIESVVINAGDILGTCRSRIIINID